MPSGNAIELFNCSLCSFCETSLDRLSHHIRSHIKPEPGILRNFQSHPAEKESYVTPRGYHNGSSTTVSNNIESNAPINNGVSTIEYFARKQLTDASNAMEIDADVTPPQIEIVNPRSVISESSPKNDTKDFRQDPLAQQQTAIAPASSKHKLPPRLIEQPPQVQLARNIVHQLPSMSPSYQATQMKSLSQKSTPTLQSNNRYEAEYGNQIRRDVKQRHEMHHANSYEAQQHHARFLPLQSREAHYDKQGRVYAYSAINGNVPPPYVNDHIPIGQTKLAGNYRELQPLPVEIDPYRRGIPNPQDRNKNMSNSIAVVSPPNQRNGQLLTADSRHRPREYFDAPLYAYPPQIRSKYEEVFQGRPHHQQPQKTHLQPAQSPVQLGQHSGNVCSPRAPFRSSQRYDHVSQDSRNSVANLQTRVSSIHYSDVKAQQTINPIGVPNKGTIILNPDQLLSATGNESLDQLAGLLIVPLKKTAEVSTQTVPIEFKSDKRSKQASTNMSAQTELKMTQISEDMFTRSPASVFDSIRSTDNLFECLVCGSELASDHHLQEHISQNHTHVCEKCYHSSTNLSEHNNHVLECGNLGAEMLCMECNSCFTSLKKFNQHRSKTHGVRMPFRCGICNIPFETHESVMTHIATHDTDAPEFKCRHCIKLFQSAGALSIHITRHKTVEILHECRFCKKSFSSASLLQDHVGYLHVITELNEKARNDDEVQYAETVARNLSGNSFNNSKKHPLCRHCDLAFKNSELLRRHVEICSKNPDAKTSAFVCDVCKEYFSSDHHRKQHLKQDHRRTNGYRCPKCSKIYRTWSRLKFHTKQQHLKKTCSDCDMVFTKEHILRKHQEDVHGKPQGQPGERVYTCSLCNTMLNTLTELMNHRRDVHPELAGVKSADQSSSATMLSLKENDYSGSDDDDFDIEDIDGMNVGGRGDVLVSKCTECNESFASNKLLNQHIQAKHLSKQSKDGQYECIRCGMKFEDEKRLKNHRGLIHGERPFECKVCDKKFQYSSQVTWHVRNVHKGRGKEIIGNRSTGGLWKPKSKLLHNKSNHVCQFCGARFKQEKLLKNHKGLIHKIKLFACEICDSKFGHSTELIWHSRTCQAKFRRQNPGLDLPSSKNANYSDDNEEEFHDDFAPTMTSSRYNDQLDESNFSSHETPSSSKFERERKTKAIHLQLNGDEAAELLRNEPQFDSSIGEYSCPICQKTTRSITGMKTHYGRCHGVWGKETSHRANEGREVTIYPCKQCTSEYKSFEELREHATNEHGVTLSMDEVDVETRFEFENIEDIMYTCPHCHVSFDNSKAIRVHAFKKHGILLSDGELATWKGERNTSNQNFTLTQAIGNAEQIRYKCRHCKAKFRNTKAIRLHTFKAHGYVLSKKELNVCRQTIPGSTNEGPVNRNKGRDLIDEPNPCDKCGRVFGNYRALFTHYRQAHRMMNDSFVPRKPSRTELTSNFKSSDKLEAMEAEAPSCDISEQQTSPSPSMTQLADEKPSDSLNVTTSSATDCIQCPKCDRSFTVHKSLVAHLYSAHKISKEHYAQFWPNGVPELPRISSNCPTCNKECVDARAMRIHLYKAHGVRYRDLNPDIEVVMSADKSKEEESTEETIHEETQLSVNVDIHGPPVCYICDRMFKGRRALMTHEHKFHGIRWVNLKRIFPEKVRNLPGELEKQPHTVNNDSFDTSRLAIKKPPNGFECVECKARFQNRRAVTTHLCRIHKYKKDKIHAYLKQTIEDGNANEEDGNANEEDENDNSKTDLEETLEDGANLEIDDIIKDIENGISNESAELMKDIREDNENNDVNNVHGEGEQAEPELTGGVLNEYINSNDSSDDLVVDETVLIE